MRPYTTLVMAILIAAILAVGVIQLFFMAR